VTGFGCVEKVFLEYEEPWWEPEAKGFVFGPDPAEKDPLRRAVNWVYVHGSVPGVLYAWFAGPEVDAVEAASDAEVVEAVSAVLAKYLGRKDVPRPRRLVRSSWRADPLIGGAYSYLSAESERLGVGPRQLAEPVCVRREGGLVPRLVFAGEATSEKHFTTTHGAFWSGQREAQRLADFYAAHSNKAKL
jgi:spermine oxidase